jgi:hypothetical protein
LSSLGVTAGLALAAVIVGWIYYLESRVQVLEFKAQLQKEKDIDAQIIKNVSDLTPDELQHLLGDDLSRDPSS